MALSRRTLEDRLGSGPPWVLDGALGTELERRGFETRLPLWSAAALERDPELVGRIHADYVEAGVDALTANTFRTQRRVLAHAGLGERAAAWTRRAVELARGAAGERCWVLGSSPTLEDCYRPDLVPPPADLAREHSEHAQHLADAGVDAILLETMNTLAEARAGLRAAEAVATPALVSFVCWDGARLLSGEPLGDALAMAADEGACALAVNCLPPSNVAACIDVLAAQALPFGLYPNLGAPDDAIGFRRREELDAEQFAELVAGNAARGARWLGGCCGTTPAHLAALVRRIGARSASK